jgi:hypothetical protein
MGIGQLDQAIAAFGQSLALDAKLAPTHINLGNALPPAQNNWFFLTGLQPYRALLLRSGLLCRKT